jgi:RHS repeat-associated protein
MRAAQATKEKMSTPVFSLAASAAASSATPLNYKTNPIPQMNTAEAKTCIRGFNFAGTTCISSPTWLSSTSRPACTYSYDPIAVVQLVQRYFSSQYGRFTTPDPYDGSAAPENPLSWARYTYVSGDPINDYDPTGLDCVLVDKGNGVFVLDCGYKKPNDTALPVAPLPDRPLPIGHEGADGGGNPNAPPVNCEQFRTGCDWPTPGPALRDGKIHKPPVLTPTDPSTLDEIGQYPLKRTGNYPDYFACVVGKIAYDVTDNGGEVMIVGLGMRLIPGGAVVGGLVMLGHAINTNQHCTKQVYGTPPNEPTQGTGGARGR